MILTRTEYGTDGNIYELSISNGEEYKTQKMIPIEVLDKIRAEIEWHRDHRLSFEGNAEVIELTNYYLNIIDKYRKEQE